MWPYSSDRKRHAILRTLNVRTNGQAFVGSGINTKDWMMPVNEICEHAGITVEDYRLVNSRLYDRKEIDIVSENGKEHAFILQKGLTALNEKKYTQGSARRRNANILTVVTWVGTIIIGAATLYSLWVSYAELSDIRQRLNKLEQAAPTNK